MSSSSPAKVISMENIGTIVEYCRRIQSLRDPRSPQTRGCYGRGSLRQSSKNGCVTWSTNCFLQLRTAPIYVTAARASSKCSSFFWRSLAP